MNELIEKYSLENAFKHGGKAQQGAVIGSCIASNPEVKKDMKKLAMNVGRIIKKVNSMSVKEQKKRLEELAPELLEKKKGKEKGLFDSFKVEGDVVTAFPPEPSKYPHIGHAKALLVNYEFAKEHGGKFILRFEDTNPELAKKEYYEIIENNIKWLGVKPDKIDYASDYMEKFYLLAEKLIMLGRAYICTCETEAIRESRMKGKACNCRYNHIKENFIGWKKMHFLKQGEAILRLKIDLKHKNSAMRDPTIFRIIRKPHCRLKRKYTVWPNYDFENSVMDGVEGVTHRFRSKEFELRNELQRYIQKLLGFDETSIFEFARFNMRGVESSGRIIREKVESKKLIGWDDPLLTTLVALKRRGFLPEAIKSFVLSTGITKSESTLTWDDLILHNKRILDSKVNRYYFIKDPVRVRIQDAPSLDIELNLHPEDEKRGKRKFHTEELFFLSQEDVDSFKENSLYRLMGGFNFVKKNDYFIYKGMDHETFKKKGQKIVHWLPFSSNGSGSLVETEVLMPDKELAKGLSEPLVSKLKEGDIVQFERFGFCRLDKKTKSKLSFWFTH